MTPDEIQVLRAPIVAHAMETLQGKRTPGVLAPPYPIEGMREFVEDHADKALKVAGANLPPGLSQPILATLEADLSRQVADSAVLLVGAIFRARTKAGIDLS